MKSKTREDQAASSVEYRLLGPLEIVSGGKLNEIRSVRQQTLLAMLLLHAKRLVPAGVLIDAIWNDMPPATARSQLQTCISGLRHQLARIGAKSEIATRSVGYMFVIRNDVLDIQTFGDLARSGRASAAAGRADEAIRGLRAALALWRGTAIAGIESTLVQAAATRLNEDRLGLYEECIDLELALGMHRDLIGELSELVQQYPLREKLRAQHMLCLYRSGRKAHALESFRVARQIFIDELGLDPGHDLRELERAILGSDQKLDLERGVRSMTPWVYENRVPVPRQMPTAIADFTGRQDIMQTLIELLSGRPESDEPKYLPVIALNGKGGIGKTALALQVAHAVREDYPDGQLFAQLTEADGQPVPVPTILEQFLRALGMPPSSVPSDVTERIAAYRTALGDRRVLIVLDSAESVSQVLMLIPGSANCAVIVTSHSPLSYLQGAHHFEVQDLDEQTSIKLLAKVIGHDRVRAEESSALAIVRLCGGVPLALRIVAAKLAKRTHWPLEKMVRRMTDDERRLDELALGGMGIRATLTLSYGGLSDQARRLFSRLSLLGTSDFASWVSAPLLDLDAEMAADELDTLIEAHLVEVWASEDGSPRFRLHDLARLYALERVAAEESTAERFRARERLLQCWLSLATEAHRRCYGGDYAVLHGSATHWALPSDFVDLLLQNPMDWLRTERAGLVSAILQAAQASMDELCWDLALTSVTLFESHHYTDDWYKTHEAALAVTRRAANLRGEAAILCSFGNLTVGLSPGRATQYLEPALQIFNQIGDTHGKAWVLSLQAHADRQCGRYDQAMACYLDALNGFQAVGDRVSEVDALTGIAQIHISCERMEMAEEFLSKALVICGSLKAPRVMARTQHRLGEFFLNRNDLERADWIFSSVLDLVRDQRDLVGETYALLGLGTVHTRQESYDLAETELRSALALSRQVGDNLAQERALLVLAESYMAMGEPERAVPLINEAAVVIGEIGPSSIWREAFLELRTKLDEQLGLAPEADGLIRVPVGPTAVAWIPRQTSSRT